MILGGPLKSKPRGPWVAQTYRFRRDIFTPEQARQWIKRNLEGKCLSFETATGRGAIED